MMVMILHGTLHTLVIVEQGKLRGILVPHLRLMDPVTLLDSLPLIHLIQNGTTPCLSLMHTPF